MPLPTSPLGPAFPGSLPLLGGDWGPGGHAWGSPTRPQGGVLALVPLCSQNPAGLLSSVVRSQGDSWRPPGQRNAL